MDIKKNEYFNGNVVSLGYVKEGVTQISAGLIKKGKYDFGNENLDEQQVRLTSAFLHHWTIKD